MFAKMLKWLPVLAIFCMGFAYAEEEAPSDDKEVAYSFSNRDQDQNSKGFPSRNAKSCKKPCEKKCPKPTCKVKCVCERMGFKPLPPCCPPCQPDCCPPLLVYNHNVTPPARCTECNIGLFFTADFLWWKADEKNFGFTFKATDNPSTGHVEHFHYKWKPGFRFGIGGDLPYDGWDMNFTWTWFRSTSHRTITSPTSSNGEGVIAAWLAFPQYKVVSANAKWRLLLNMADLEVGRDFFVSCGLSLRPFAGVEGGWIDRKFGVSYGAPDPSLTSPDAPGSYNGKSNVWGVGPRGGLNTSWHVGMGFNFTSNFAYSLLYGEVFENDARVVQTHDGVPNQITANVDDDDSLWTLTPHLQAMLGFGWGSCFNCNKLFFSVNAAWEVNYYWGLPHFVYSSGFTQTFLDTFSRDLSMVGLTLDFKIDF